MKIEIKRSHRKTMSIIVRDGSVLVRAPFLVSEAQIENFVKSKENWIEKKLREHRPIGFIPENKSIRIFGIVYPVVITIGSRFAMSMTQSLNLTKPQAMSEKRFVELVELHFKNELETILETRVKHYAGLLHIKTPDFSIRRFKRLYGRCTRDHRLAFNTYLFHDSLEFIDYVVLHECAHILEFNHSKAFYDIIKRFMPNYKHVIAANKT